MVQSVCICYASLNYLNTILCTFSVPIFFRCWQIFALYSWETRFCFLYISMTLLQLKTVLLAWLQLKKSYCQEWNLKNAISVKQSCAICCKMRILVNVFRVLPHMLSVTNFAKRLQWTQYLSILLSCISEFIQRKT